MAKDNSVVMNQDTNTTIVIGNCFNWAITKDQDFLYMEAQFAETARRRLSFNLPELLSFPTCVRFVGIDIDIESNMPAANKSEILCTWPEAVDIPAVTSFIVFGIWYPKWIPYFEIKVQPLRKITK